MQDVASALGVTRSTVSRALNGHARISEETRTAVMEVARNMGFEPNLQAQRLKNNHRENTIFLFSYQVDYHSGSHKLRLIQSLLRSRGYAAPIYIFNEAEEDGQQAEHLKHLRRERPRAIVLNSATIDDRDAQEIERYVDTGGIVICYDFDVPLDCDRIVFDREHNTYIAVQHLLELGHRDIGFYFNRSSKSTARWSGIVSAMREYSAPIREEWLFDGMGEEAAGADLAHKYLGLAQRPSAMCIINDVTATAFIAELQRHGLRVPRDLSVVGHDDLPAGRYFNSVQLTSAAQPINEIAASVVNLLDQRFSDANTGQPQHIVVRGELKPRESSAPFNRH